MVHVDDRAALGQLAQRLQGRVHFHRRVFVFGGPEVGERIEDDDVGRGLVEVRDQVREEAEPFVVVRLAEEGPGQDADAAARTSPDVKSVRNGSHLTARTGG